MEVGGCGVGFGVQGLKLSVSHLRVYATEFSFLKLFLGFRLQVIVFRFDVSSFGF